MLMRISTERPLAGSRRDLAACSCYVITLRTFYLTGIAMRRLFAIATVLCGMSGATSDAHGPAGEHRPHAAGTVKAFRLVVADAKAATLKIFDLENGQLLAALPLASPARLHAGPSG